MTFRNASTFTLMLVCLGLMAGCGSKDRAASNQAASAKSGYDFVIRGGTIYDGSGQAPFQGDVAIQGDRIAYVGPKAPQAGREEIDATGKAVSPGFVNMLAHPEESLLVDGRALSDLRTGGHARSHGRGLHGAAVPADERPGAAAPGRHQIRHRLDDAR